MHHNKESQKEIRNRRGVKLPKPMMFQKNYDFSFSGLKTAVLYNYKSQDLKTQKDKDYIREVCYEAQKAIIDVLLFKTIKAVKDYNVKSLILGGGVTANGELRKSFQEKIDNDLPGVNLYLPNIKYSTDNSLMIGLTAYYHWLNGKKPNLGEISVDANLRV